MMVPPHLQMLQSCSVALTRPCVVCCVADGDSQYVPHAEGFCWLALAWSQVALEHGAVWQEVILSMCLILKVFAGWP